MNPARRLSFFFFFQAEDGIRDIGVTGVQTCALPIFDQQLYLQGFLPVTQCVLSKKYGFTGLSTNTGSGVVTPETIGELVPLIEAGIREIGRASWRGRGENSVVAVALKKKKINEA